MMDLPELDLRDTAPLDDDIPPEIQASIERHRRALTSLIQNLRSCGLDEAAIEANVAVIIESYRAELAAALRSMGQVGHA